MTTPCNVWPFDVLPSRPSPFPGECLSGYLLRLANTNGYIKVGNLIEDLFPSYGIRRQSEIANWEIPLRGWEHAPIQTGLSSTELIKLTFSPLLHKFGVLPSSRVNRGKLRFLPDLVNPTLRICPLCLKSQPFIRLLWRITSVNVCLKHRVFLQERCTKCNTILTPIGPQHGNPPVK